MANIFEGKYLRGGQGGVAPCQSAPPPSTFNNSCVSLPLITRQEMGSSPSPGNATRVGDRGVGCRTLPSREVLCRGVPFFVPSHGEWGGVCMGMDIVSGWCGGVFVIDESGPVVHGGGTTPRWSPCLRRRRGARRGEGRRGDETRAPSLFDGRRFDHGACATMGRCDGTGTRGRARRGVRGGDEGRRGARGWMRR